MSFEAVPENRSTSAPTVSVGAEVTSGSRLFQRRFNQATGNARSPTKFSKQTDGVPNKNNSIQCRLTALKQVRCNLFKNTVAFRIR